MCTIVGVQYKEKCSLQSMYRILLVTWFMLVTLIVAHLWACIPIYTYQIMSYIWHVRGTLVYGTYGEYL